MFEILKRIEASFDAASLAMQSIDPLLIDIRRKSSGEVITQMDTAINRALQEILLQPGEGWLSEESPDNVRRLKLDRVWIVDPLDGTREFVLGNPEWAISVGYIVGGEAVAGGVWNPATKELFLGAFGIGTTLNGVKVSISGRTQMQGSRVLASHTEVNAGVWQPFEEEFRVDAIGSIAYKLALVAAGHADATWTMGPRNEWDVAAGVALVAASNGVVLASGGVPIHFNQANPLLRPFLAANRSLSKQLLAKLTPRRQWS